MNKIILLVLFVSSCGGEAWAKKQWGRRPDCGIICDYYTGTGSDWRAIGLAECHCFPPGARNVAPTLNGSKVITCEYDCKSYAERILGRRYLRGISF